MHNDEGVNAMKFRRLYVNNDYKYDPNEFHGPTLPYLTLPAAWLQGGGDFNDFTEATYRSVPVVFGLGLILLLLLLAPEFGRAETLWAAAFTALSRRRWFFTAAITFTKCCWSFSPPGLLSASGAGPIRAAPRGPWRADSAWV